MKTFLTTLAVLVMAGLTQAVAQPTQFVLESVRDGVSPPLTDVVGNDLAAATTFAPEAAAAAFIGEVGDGTLSVAEMVTAVNSSVVQAKVEASESAVNTSMLSTSGANLLQLFDGMENDDNAFTLVTLVAPPDTDGDVGPNHYMQTVNILTEIFDKTGTSILGPFPNNAFYAGLGGLCENTNRGDPIVLYDEENDRWFASQFAFDSGFTQFSLCIALSTTADPTGSYYQHEFDFTSIGFPDYPKYGFATDGIGLMVNLFTPPTFFFGGTGLAAIDKAEAYSAGPATMVFFNLGTSEFGFLPGDNDGPVFTGVTPTFATNNGGFGNSIDIWEIIPDWVTPANSTIGEVASIPVLPMDRDLCPAVRERCIDQPGSGTGTPPNNITFLEAISDRLMHRFQIRNFGGGDMRGVTNHTLDADGTGKAGVRWYEFRNGGSGWGLHQEGTFSPDDDHRWMGSIAMNRAGDICLGYSISSQNTLPAIGSAGQSAAASGSGFLDSGELVIFAGANVQRQTSRWGDYSAMAIDPVSDTFWYTQEYAFPNSFIGERFGWATKIAQLEHEGLDVVNVEVDIKPGSYPNSVNCNVEDEVIAVAILSTDTFDATTVDHTTVVFEGASEAHVNRRTGVARRHEEDVDDDGDTDLVFHFRFGDTHLSCADTDGTIAGLTFGGTLVIGTDAIRMVDAANPKADLIAEAVELPSSTTLMPNYPNPFNPATMLTVALTEESEVRLAIYDVLGREVTVLLHGTMTAGEHRVMFQADGLPSGVYIARMDTPLGTFVRKMQLVK